MKKILSIVLALGLVLGVAGSVWAATITTDQGTGDTTLIYSVATAFSVTIPETVTLGTTAVDGNLTVDITNIPYNTKIYAAITATSGDSNAFTVKSESDNTKTIPYTVQYKNTSQGNYSDYAIGTSGAPNKVGGLTADGIIYFQYALGAIPDNSPAGAYNGTVTFTIFNEAEPTTP